MLRERSIGAVLIRRFCMAACVALTACIAMSVAGCGEKDHLRLNAPPQGDAAKHPVIHEYFCYHNDQGMMADMSIADVHFIPHSADLSGTGQARLERYAELLASSGGTICYDTAVQDEKLVEARLATARAFLARTMPSVASIQVELGLPGGRGMAANEAIAGQAVAKQPEPRQTAYKLSDSDSSGD